MKPARAEATNSTALAISSGSPQRPSGTLRAPAAFLLLQAAAEVELAVEIELGGERAGMRLGQTALTRMPSRPKSSDSDFTNACCAALTTAEPMTSLPRHLAGLADDQDDATAALLAHVRCDLAGPAPTVPAPWCAGGPRAAPSSDSSSRPFRCVPALLTTMSMRPSFATVRCDQPRHRHAGQSTCAVDADASRRAPISSASASASLASSRPQMNTLTPSSPEDGGRWRGRCRWCRR